MILLLFLGALLTVISFFTFVVPVQTSVAALEPSAQSVAATLLREHKAAVAWCQQSESCADGPLALGTDTALPAGYARSSWVTVTVDSGLLATYTIGSGVPPQSVALALVELSHGNRNVGLARDDGGTTRVLSGQGMGAWTQGSLEVPAGVPLGVPVAVTRVPVPAGP